MVSFSITFSNVLLMLLYLLPGFLFCKTKKIQPDHLSSVSVILLYICGFALYVNALYGLKPSPELFAKMGLFLLISLACETAVMLLILLLLGRNRRKEFGLRMLSIAAVMGNVGFFGMPVVRALFPEAPEAAVYSSMFNAALNILAWTVGVFTLTGEKKYISLKSALLNPSMLACFTGLVLCLLNAGEWLPGLLRNGLTSCIKFSKTRNGLVISSVGYFYAHSGSVGDRRIKRIQRQYVASAENDFSSFSTYGKSIDGCSENLRFVCKRHFLFSPFSQ